MTTTYRVAGLLPAYGVRPGDLVELDETDALVQVNESAGTIEKASRAVRKGAEPAMECPLCVERKEKKPARLKSQDELAAHYAEAHPGFVVPDAASLLVEDPYREGR